jgi:hypothetical protein
VTIVDYFHWLIALMMESKPLMLVKVVACLMVATATEGWSQHPTSRRINVTPSVGYSIESFSWSIAGVNAMNQPVNILSELKWRNINSTAARLRAEVFVWTDVFMRADFSKAFIISGKVSDTDYGRDNRIDPTFHDVFDSDKGGSTSFVLTTGYRMHLPRKSSVGVFVGYAHETRLLYLLRDNGNVQGDLKSTYHARWKGVVFGVDIILPAHKKLQFIAEGNYHHHRYDATADWNLIADFAHPVSFRHQAKGHTLSLDAGLQYIINRCINIRLTAVHGASITGAGIDTLYRSNGDIDVTRLNTVRRSSMILCSGLTMKL